MAIDTESDDSFFLWPKIFFGQKSFSMLLTHKNDEFEKKCQNFKVIKWAQKINMEMT